MASVHVAFDSAADAYAFVAELRRRGSTMLWDVRVRSVDGRRVVVLPDERWTHHRWVSETAGLFDGTVLPDMPERSGGTSAGRGGVRRMS